MTSKDPIELEKNRDQWKQEAKTLRGELDETKAELKKVRQERDQLDEYIGTLQDSLVDAASRAPNPRLESAARFLAARIAVVDVRITEEEIAKALRNADDLIDAERETR